jgi:hypothetical protein
MEWLMQAYAIDLFEFGRGSKRWTTDASMLRFPPGQWPRAFMIDDGVVAYRATLDDLSVSAAGASYTIDEQADTKIFVFND